MRKGAVWILLATQCCWANEWDRLNTTPLLAIILLVGSSPVWLSMLVAAFSLRRRCWSWKLTLAGALLAGLFAVVVEVPLCCLFGVPGFGLAPLAAPLAVWLLIRSRCASQQQQEKGPGFSAPV